MKSKIQTAISIAIGSLCLLVGSSVFGVTLNSPLDSDNNNKFTDVYEILDSVAVPANSPIADANVQNNGNVKVATIFVVRWSLDSSIRLIFQATNGNTKTGNNIAAVDRANDCGYDLPTGGTRFFFDGDIVLSNDGALLVAEGYVGTRGGPTDTNDRAVAVWRVQPDGNSGGQATGGKIICMTEFTDVQALRTDTLPGQYLIVGKHLVTNAPSTMVVTR